ncbi:dihydroxyacetone kinase subunit L [Nocardiopsis sp. HNM0947]|uniref:Dihydroxyacetone kinase subunit L n=1 Tax=Nocardiopsis coralli TaxID=2772213 RepID=A0ABR9P2X2_9ACTN|nr:dihydroxyacetone kinase subunit DhaL [Nocardiopsis coralli]MBE2998206.1 dihydroxyacetone kinase subunit L [Nocardiopsis coralli]
MTDTGDAARLSGPETKAWFLAFADRVSRGADDLTDLDRRAGDGDFGWNIDTSLGRARSALEGIDPGHPAEVFRTVSDTFLASGGTSGPLFGLWFGRVAHGPEAPWAVADLASVFDTATAAVQRLGGAQVGQKTMVDAMAPAVQALAGSASTGWRDALREAAEAAYAGAESTGGMVARKGRASYLGERAADVVDPGALSIAWFFASAADV